MNHSIVQTAAETWIDHPSGWLALASGNLRFEMPGLAGLICYREHGQHLVIFGGVHAPPENRKVLLGAFLVAAQRRRRRVLAVQLRAEQARLFADCGFCVNRLGSSYSLSLESYSLAGARRMKLRQKVRRARRAGLQVFELGVELARDRAAFARLAEISQAWLAAKGKKELDFMIGQLGRLEETRRRVFVVARSPEVSGWLGFITYVPAWGARPGYLHDLTRRLPDAPPGAMELCNHEAIERLRAEGCRNLHFGFTPFVLDPDGCELPGASRFAALVIRLLGRYGRAVYPAQDQVRYKRKWDPDLVEEEAIAFRPLSLRAIVDLLFLTRSL